MLSCDKAEYSMEISKWIFRMTLPQEIKLDLREIILFNSQSTMDLFCNAALIFC
jgi:hypothetical protein